jgi:hypothetical protein
VAGFLPLRSEPQLVGLMSHLHGAYFAVRPDENRAVEWVTQGSSVGGYMVQSYDPKTESLLLQQGDRTLTLQLPSARIQPLQRNEILTGLGLILNLPPTQSILNFIHPGLRPAAETKESDPMVFARILNPSTKAEIRALPPEFDRALAASLAAVARATGIRPTHGLWIKDDRGFSMTFVVQEGNSWYLAPGNLKSIQPAITKDQPPPPAAPATAPR